jgi:hypothetical protein
MIRIALFEALAYLNNQVIKGSSFPPTKGAVSRPKGGIPLQRWFAPPAARINVGVEPNSAFAPPQAVRTRDMLKKIPQ